MAAECLKLLLDLRQTMPYFDSVKVRFSMERQKYPGLKVLNTAFGDARVPFIIVNRQQGKSRETYWYIEKKKRDKGSGASFAGCSEAHGVTGYF